MSSPRWGCGAAAVGEQIYVFGGINNTKYYLDLVEVYNTTNGLWQLLKAKMKTPRSIFGIAAVYTQTLEGKPRRLLENLTTKTAPSQEVPVR